MDINVINDIKINVVSNNKVNVTNDIKINVVSNNKVNVINDIKMLPINIEMSLQRWKELAGKKKKSNNIMRTGVMKLKIINLNEPPVQTFIEEERNQSQRKNEEQTKKNKEQTEKLALMPLLGAPPAPPLEPPEEFRDPEAAARPKEKSNCRC